MRKILNVAAALGMVLFLPMICHAGAGVLPQKVWMVNGTYTHYFDIEQKYNENGELEDLAGSYNGTLDSRVFTSLAPLDAFVPGLANVGDAVVKFTRVVKWFDFEVSYGLTDKLTMNVKLPIVMQKNKVEASLDTTNANVGKSPNGSQFAATPLAPLSDPFAFGDVVPLTTDDVINMIGGGLEVDAVPGVDVAGFGYKPFETWEDTGIGDIPITLKYKYYDEKPWRVAFGGGIVLPTGEADDPDSLVDYAVGGGQTDLFGTVYLDYTGLDKWLFTSTFKYIFQLPDKETRRVYADVNSPPITLLEEDVDRDLGDIFETELMAQYSFSDALSTNVKYRYTKKGDDAVDGDMGYDYSALEAETAMESHMAFVSVAYSTVQMYLDKQFPIPFTFNLTYRDRFAGKNNATDSQFISGALTFFYQ